MLWRRRRGCSSLVVEDFPSRVCSKPFNGMVLLGEDEEKERYFVRVWSKNGRDDLDVVFEGLSSLNG